MGASIQSLKATFNGGEITPILQARPDVAAYNNGCRILQNMIPRPHGGVFKRPGTEYVGTVKDEDNPPILRGFRRSTEVNFIFEMGDEYMRFWYDNAGTGTQLKTSSLGTPPTFAAWATSTSYAVGDYVYRSGVTYQCINAHNSSTASTQPGTGTGWQVFWEQFFYSAGEAYSISGNAYTVKETHSPDGLTTDLTKFYQLEYDGVSAYIYEIATPWAVEDVLEVQLCQLNDVVFFTHPSYEPRRLTRVGNEEWALEKVPFEFAPTIDPEQNNVTLKLVYNAPAWVASTAYTANVSFVVYQDELYICNTSNTDGAFTGAKWTKAIYKSGWNTGQSYVAGNVAEESGQNYICISGHTSGTFATDLAFPRWVRIPYTDYKLYGAFNTFTDDEEDTVWLLKPGTTDRVVREAITGSATKTTATIFIQGDFAARTEWSSSAGPANTTIRLLESLDRNNWTVVREWVNNATTGGTIRYEAEAPQKGAWYRMESTAAGAVAATSYMVIEPLAAQLSIPFRIETYVSGREVHGVAQLAADKTIPNEALGVSFPVFQRGAFSAARGWPRAVAFHDGRLWFASTATEPARMWASQLDDFYNFLPGTLATSGLDLTLASTQANEIMWMASFNSQLVVGTTGEEWTIDSGDTDGALTPTSARARRRTRFGSGTVPPQLTGNALLWISRNGLTVREFAYDFGSDAFVANDMTLLAEHITSGGIKQVAFASEDDQILWCIRNDDVLIGLTYQREQQVVAWHRHETSFGSFTSVATIYGNPDSGLTADQVWFVAERTTGVYIERFNPLMAAKSTILSNQNATDYCLVDCATRVPTDTDTLTGMDRLINTALGIYTQDGETVGSSDLSTGTMILSEEVPEDSWAGIPYMVRLQPSRLHIDLRDGTGLDRNWRMSRVTVIPYGATGGLVKQSLITDGGYDIQYSREEEGTVIKRLPARTGIQFDWEPQGPGPILEQFSAGPFGILAMVLKVEVDGD